MTLGSTQFRECSTHSIRPYAMMLAPVYVYMKLNNRFVKIKGTFDFFTEEELEKLKRLDRFYFPQDIGEALRFREYAHDVRELLSWETAALSPYELREKTEAGRTSRKELVPLRLASYEISDALIRTMAPLWEKGPSIDPFLVAIFVNELCDLFSPEQLKSYRERSVVDYEKAVVLSGWTVFLALHLGYTQLSFLNWLRAQAMHASMAGSFENSLGEEFAGEMRDLMIIAQDSLGGDIRTELGARVEASKLAGRRSGIASEKISSRMKRLEGLVHA